MLLWVTRVALTPSAVCTVPAPKNPHSKHHPGLARGNKMSFSASLLEALDANKTFCMQKLINAIDLCYLMSRERSQKTFVNLGLDVTSRRLYQSAERELRDPM